MNRHSVFILACIFSLAALLPFTGCRRKPAASSADKVTTLTTKSGIEMVLIPAGEFTMGDSAGEDDEKPPHRVKLRGFCMDKCEVTQKSYESLMGKNPSRFKGPDNPVERVSWRSAIEYCNMRSQKEGLTPCYDLKSLACNFDANGYRLPTEAEWEYACRAGTQTPCHFGAGESALRAHAWFQGNSSDSTHPVGQKKPNPWGLCDMYGNVAEWCNDRYAENAYTNAASDNPRGPAAGNDRVVRGGSWRDVDGKCRSSARTSESPAFADACFGSERYGFRCVRSAEPRP